MMRDKQKPIESQDWYVKATFFRELQRKSQCSEQDKVALMDGLLDKEWVVRATAAAVLMKFGYDFTKVFRDNIKNGKQELRELSDSVKSVEGNSSASGMAELTELFNSGKDEFKP